MRSKLCAITYSVFLSSVAVCPAFAQKPTAIAIGINTVNPEHYDGWSGPLAACEADARDMAEIARSQGFSATEILTSEATRDTFWRTLRKAANDTPENGIVVISYSGHGGHVPDIDGDEVDGQDETWCLYDGQLLDDELSHAWTFFKRGVRVVVFSDSCNSGSVIKMREVASIVEAEANEGPAVGGLALAEEPFKQRKDAVRQLGDRVRDFLAEAPEAGVPTGGPVGGGKTNAQSPIRAMPPAVGARTSQKHKAFYEGLQLMMPPKSESAQHTSATILLISGCQDSQLSLDGNSNGLFTGTLKRVWNSGGFVGNYKAFHSQIADQMPPYQTPNYLITGSANPAFENQKPYSK